MKKWIIWLLILPFTFSFSEPDAKKILEQTDKNISSKNRIVESSMTIHGRRTSRTLTAKTWSVGTTKSFTEYLSPASEKGTKMLKLEGQLWIYSPSTDRIINISGHMLRQSLMGSDLSYEDMMEDRKLTEAYNAKVIKQEVINKRRSWKLELNTKLEDVAYPKQNIWIDSERYVPLKQEMFARSGKLLKTVEFSDVKRVQGRWFPHTMLYNDVLKQGKGTEFKITSIKFDQEIPDRKFTQGALRR